MKTIVFSLLIGTFSGQCEAQQVEPYGDMSKPVAVIFNEDMARLENLITHNLGRLQGVEVDVKTGKPSFERKSYRPDWPKEWSTYSSLVTNAAQMEMVSITAWWMPPKPKPQKISEGGGNIQPVRSEIWITLGCLKTNHQASVIRLRREWVYKSRAHIPYTEIPLWRGKSEMGGSYPSDHDWLHSLEAKKIYPADHTCLAYDSEIVEVLRTLPSEQTEK